MSALPLPPHLDDERAQRFLDGHLPRAEAGAAREHIAGCSECRLLVESYRALAAALDDLEAPAAPAGFTEAVLARIDERERTASRERRLAAAILGGLALAGVGLVAVTGPASWAPVLTRVGDLFGGLATGLHVAVDVAGPVVRALRVEIAAAAAGAAIPLLIALARLSTRRGNAVVA
jgi:anti-sigma factor RsiW